MWTPNGYLLKICLLQAVVVGMMTWQLYTAKEREVSHDHKRMAFCLELSKALPHINCKALEE